MARPLRLELAGGLYHITSRGDRREDIYVDDADREKWLDILGHVCKQFNWRCHAYCQMDNHYHIIIETAEANLSKGMRHLNGVYTQHYNRRHKRVGHVYQGRYKAILVERDMYLLELSRYVVLNPIRARIINNIEEWKWSSYPAMIMKAPALHWLETDWLLGQFAKRRKVAIKKYIDFVREGIGLPSLWGNLQNQIFLGTADFINKKQNQINKKESLDEVPRLHKRKLPKPLSYYEKKYKDQRQAMIEAYSTGCFTLKEIGDYFGKHYSTISRIVKETK